MRSSSFLRHLLRKVARRDASVAVIGLGAVGLPLALTFAKAGFRCSGFDIDAERVADVNAGNATGHGQATNKILKKCLKRKSFYATRDITLTEGPDFLILCLPTPLTQVGQPDLSYLTTTCSELSHQNLSKKCVILESSVYPGVTRNIVKPCLERGAYTAGVDFGLAHSPERMDFGNPNFPLDRIPKLVGGINEASTQVAASLYDAILKVSAIRVRSLEIAEAAKMLENTYRFVNISLINQLASLFEALSLDAFDVVNAASTKPFGFMAHYPGPGVGGHCIPKDPIYLMKAAHNVGKKLTMVEAALSVNRQLPKMIASRIEDALKIARKRIKGARIAVLGLAYKRNVGDTRRSPALAIIAELKCRGAVIRAHDPSLLNTKTDMPTVELTRSLKEALQGADVLLLATDHDVFRKIDIAKIRRYLARNPILFDSKNFWDGRHASRLRYLYLGVGKPLIGRRTFRRTKPQTTHESKPTSKMSPEVSRC